MSSKTLFAEYPIFLITGEPQDDEEKFLSLLEKSLQRGIKLVQIRAKALSSLEYKKLATEAVKMCHQFDAKAILNNHVDLLEDTDADGIHLTSDAFMKMHQRPVADHYIFSAACHNEEQIMQARNIQADLITLSPVFATPSSPQGVPLGWGKFAFLAGLARMPVYALGGMTADHIKIAKSCGATGIAAIRSIWG